MTSRRIVWARAHPLWLSSFALVLAAGGSGVALLHQTHGKTHVLAERFTNSESTKADFVLSVTPNTQAVQKGAPVTYTVSISPQDGFKDPVALTAKVQSGSGLSTAFSPSTVPSKGTSSTLTVATSSATIGTWSVTVTGTSKSLVHTVAITLTVNYPASQSFRLAASPGSVQVLPGDTAQYAVTITRTGGYSGAITLATTGLPAGATATYSPASPVTGNSTTLQVATTSSTPAGTFTIQVKGSAANQSAQTVTVQLVVTDKGKPFSISGAPTQRLSPGSIASPINLTLSNPNNQPMNVTNLTVTVVGTSAGSNCSASNFAVQQFSGTYPLALLKNQTASLQAMGIPQPKWPTVRMVNFPTVNQDACKNVTVFLSYAGAATGR